MYQTHHTGTYEQNHNFDTLRKTATTYLWRYIMDFKFTWYYEVLTVLPWTFTVKKGWVRTKQLLNYFFPSNIY